MNTSPSPTIDVYLAEYTRNDIISRYISDTAGAGIAYVLRETYGPLYDRIIDALIANRPPGHAFRILEYGCGGGMNLLKIVELFHARGAKVEVAVGTDFSPPMIEAARREAAQKLPPAINAKLTYVVARNESLASDLAQNLASDAARLHGTFDLVVGVNTFRYSHRLRRENETARDIRELLSPGGYSIMIDMNRHFPFFRSKMRNILKPASMETYVPPLQEYARPFSAAGFEVKEKRNFCWIPHSANRSLLSFCRAISPFLNACCSRWAMRSLVVARKPF